jgi:hypothetical protein
MNHFIQFLWLLAWPVIIVVCYLVISFILSNFEDKLEEEEN